MLDKLLTITQAAQFLGVSIDTLRRWDKSGKLVAIRKEGGTHRYYNQRDLELFSSDLFKIANTWALSGGNISNDLYCSNSAVFQARLIRMQEEILLLKIHSDKGPLIVAITGEIGNNSFDHNLGNWPDVPGVFFGYNIDQRMIVLADRGVGLLATLRRVKTELTTHQDALRVAFTEVISGRAPEARGNGLKFVRQVVQDNHFALFFQSGDAELRIANGQSDLQINSAPTSIQGCLTKITF